MSLGILNSNVDIVEAANYLVKVYDKLTTLCSNSNSISFETNERLTPLVSNRDFEMIRAPKCFGKN